MYPILGRRARPAARLGPFRARPGPVPGCGHPGARLRQSSRTRPARLARAVCC